MKPLDYRIHQLTPAQQARAARRYARAHWPQWDKMCSTASRRGFRSGHFRGDPTQEPPYLNIPICQDLIKCWRDGHRRGLEQFREDWIKEHGTGPLVTKATLARMKTAGGIQ